MDAVRPDALEEVARSVLPPATFAYYRQGARDGLSAAEAVDAWAHFRLVPRVLRDVRAVSLATSVLGAQVPAPLGVAPTTLQRAAHPDGEVAMATACAAVGIPMVLSSNATATFADIAATDASWWLQAYLPQDRELARPMLDAAVAAGARAVVLTVDTPLVGTKYDSGDGSVWDEVPAEWLRVNLGSAAGAPKARDLGPADIGWLHEVTGLPVAPKGVLDPRDARRALDAGAAALCVSNHGGRQLDRSPTPLELLPEVVDAVGGRAEVFLDGGVRSGADVAAAVAFGARACFVGRAYLYGLMAGGEPGVRRVLDLLHTELVRTLRLLGLTGISGLGPDAVRLRGR